MADSVPPEELSDDDREVVDGWRSEFDQQWHDQRLTAVIDKLAPLDNKLRRAVLIELIKVDIERSWKRGQPALVEDYLKRFPELGPPSDVPVDLVQAEWEARRKADPGTDPEVISRRFPLQAQLLRKLETLAGGVTEGAKTAAPADGTVGNSGTCRELRPGELVQQQLGRYRVLSVIGQGGMGTVYLAHDTQLDRQVALKVPHISSEDGPDVLARFQREARAAATLNHPHICAVHDVGQIDGIPYLTMTFIEGRSLTEMLKLYRPFPQVRAAEIVQQVARAMHEAHLKGIIHRDLKPSNVLIDQRGNAVVMDFGVARHLHAEGPQITLSGRLVGTPEYMAPEQTKGDPKTTGPASDIYSLGVILYRLICGRLPFEGPMMQVLTSLATEVPPPPSARRKEVDRQLERICLRAMARKPDDRYATMAELAEALDGYLKEARARAALAAADFEPTVIGDAPGLPPVAVRREAMSQGSAPAPTVTADQIKPLVGPTRAVPALFGLVCLLALIGTGGYIYWKRLPAVIPASTSALVVPTPTEKQAPDLAALFAQAEQAFGRKEYDQAIAELTAIVTADPKNAAAYHLRGNAYAAKGEVDQALEDYGKALDLPGGQNARAYRERGLIYVEKQQDAPAVADLSKALDADPDDVAARVARGRALLRQESFDKALIDLLHAGKLDASLALDADKLKAYTALGQTALGKKDYDRASESFKEASRLDPKNDALLRGLGDALQGKGAADKALDAYAQAWRLKPAAAENRQRLAGAFDRLTQDYFARKDYKGAVADLDRRLKQDPKNPWALYQRGRFQLAAGTDDERTERAIADLTQAHKLEPTLATEAGKLLDEAYQRVAETYFSARTSAEQKKKWQDAIDDFSKRLDSDPSNAWALCYRGRALALTGNIARALTDLDEAIQLKPNDALARRYRGDVYAQQDQFDKAVPDYQKAKELNPQDVRNWSQYLRALLVIHKGDLKAYRKGCADMIGQLGKADDPATLNQLVWLCVLVPDAVDDPGQLVELARKAVEKSTEKNSLPYRNTLAAAQLRANQLPQAEALLQENLKLRERPEHQKVPRFNDLIFLAMTKQRKGETAAARGILKDAQMDRARYNKAAWSREIEMEQLQGEAERLVKGN